MEKMITKVKESQQYCISAGIEQIVIEDFVENVLVKLESIQKNDFNLQDL